MRRTKIYISVPEAADRLGLPVAWLRREVRAGRLPSITAGRRRLVRLDDVERALSERAASVGAEGMPDAR